MFTRFKIDRWYWHGLAGMAAGASVLVVVLEGDAERLVHVPGAFFGLLFVVCGAAVGAAFGFIANSGRMRP